MSHQTKVKVHHILQCSRAGCVEYWYGRDGDSLDATREDAKHRGSWFMHVNTATISPLVTEFCPRHRPEESNGDE